jgi:ElaA protein
MPFIFKTFQELSVNELYDILKLRAEIFVVEQDCVYNDLDDFDKEAVHVFYVENHEIVATARLLQPGTRFADFSIGRVIVKKDKRGTGLGKELMNAAINYSITNWKAEKIKISAQQYLQRFYEELDFKVITEMYLEDGIPHVGMVYKTTHP